jgi:hypothetical protein
MPHGIIFTKGMAREEVERFLASLSPRSDDVPETPHPTQPPDVLHQLTHCKCGHKRMDHAQYAGHCQVEGCTCPAFEKAKPPAS